MAKQSRRAITLALCLFVATGAAPAQTFTTLAKFNGTDGSLPYAAPIQGLDGNFYGTTYTGGSGAYSGGTVFGLGSGGLKSLYSFPCDVNSCPNGSSPSGNLLLGANGDFYGATGAGGTGSCSDPGCGTIFEVSRNGVLTTLYNFNGTDGQGPGSPLLQTADGDFYGVTREGGANNNCSGGCGTVFRITESGVLTTIYRFCAEPGCPDGYNPGTLRQGSDGIFYGYTFNGGVYEGGTGGTIFEISPAGKLKTLYSFCVKLFCPDGYGPSGVVQASDGNFYGVTSRGGARSGTCRFHSNQGCGTFFKLTPAGTLTTLLSFDWTDGAIPQTLIQATDGNFYGTTYLGGSTNYYGTIFKVTPTGTLTTLYTFCTARGCPDGISPNDLVQGTDGGLYGATSYGGFHAVQCLNAGCGTVFNLNVGLSPFVALVRNSGAVGQAVRILGQGLTGTTSVSFNGTPATFTVNADTFLTATVPAGATSGFVTAVTPGGTLTSNVQFRVLP
jgi:uncharacterized repeat protein (TIGR03803 family)